ncbi:MAG: hypothetical protein AAF657_13130 [Acidobacteriota bacterium]
MTRCSILVLPPSAPPLAGARPLRQFHQLDRFASQLAAVLGAPVPIVEGDLNASPEGFVLVIGGDPAIWRNDPALAPRCVPMLVNLGDAFRCVGVLGMPAAITSEGYLDWQHGLAASGLVAGTEATRAAGLAVGASRGSASRIEGGGSLPELLARILEIYGGR